MGTKKIKGEPAGRLFARCALQILFSTGRKYNIESLHQKVRDLVASKAIDGVGEESFIEQMLALNEFLTPVGLQVKILDGAFSLWTTPVQFSGLADFLARMTGESGSLEITQGMLEVLACIAGKEPISQGEIDKIFGVDKRQHVSRLRDLHLVAHTAGEDGRLRMRTTDEFLSRFGLKSREEFLEILSGENAEDMKI